MRPPYLTPKSRAALYELVEKGEVRARGNLRLSYHGLDRMGAAKRLPSSDDTALFVITDYGCELAAQLRTEENADA